MKKIHVFSEIGKLKQVILHRPGNELRNMVPDLMEHFLFDEIPFLQGAVAEHDEFARVLRNSGAEPLYLEDLVSEAIAAPEVRESFVDDFIAEADVKSKEEAHMLKDFLLENFSTRDMVLQTMAGIRRSEFPKRRLKTLVDYVDFNYPFVTDPMPNLYFTRDTFALLGTGVSLNHMWSRIRNRETVFGKYIFRFHPLFKGEAIPFYYDRELPYHIEGGDELILSDKVLAIGISQRTEAKAIEKLAKNVLSGEDGFETILAFRIPEKRAFMHLDTVFTMIDKDIFTIHPEIEEPLVVYSLVKVGDEVQVTEETSTLESILKKYLELDAVKLLCCGGGDPIHAASEQWSDGSNTFAVAPGEVVVYDRNVATNKFLEDNGVKLHVIPSAELSRGRGGPRCMSMPLKRESL